MSELREAAMPFATTTRYYYAKEADARIHDLVERAEQAEAKRDSFKGRWDDERRDRKQAEAALAERTTELDRWRYLAEKAIGGLDIRGMRP